MTKRQKIIDQRDKLNIELTDVAGVVIDRWVIVHEPGMVPVVKRPIGRTQTDALALLRELIAHYSRDTQLTLIRLTWNHRLWADCGREAVTIDDSLAAVLARDGATA